MVNSSRQLLRHALKRLMALRGATYKDVIESGAAKSANLGRMLSAEGQNATVEQLDWLAEAFGVEAWQLIHPDPEHSQLSEAALRIARKMDQLPPDVRDRAYALFVQAVDFANFQPGTPDDAASAPGTARPNPLRRVHR